MNYKSNFFLGANSNMGFVSYFKQLQEQSDSMQLLILKGGPGSGKSSLMKRVAAFAQERGHMLEIIPCASDPSSLDALIDLTANFAMMDGTAPHIQDPSVPGALHHIIYTGDLWDTDKLYKNKDKIKKLSQSISDLHTGAGAYIKAAASLLQENIRYSENYINKEAAAEFIKKIVKKLDDGKFSTEKHRLLSAVSVGEIKLFSKTPNAFADKIYILEDNWGGASSYILSRIYDAAKLSGSDFIHCPCSIIPQKTDHLIFPEKSLAVVTENNFLPFSSGARTDCLKFYHSMPLEGVMEERLASAEKLLARACNNVEKAKRLHDELEAYYVQAMDFSRMDSFFENIKDRFYR